MPEPEWRELLSQRVLGYINWKRNRHLYHRRDMLDVLVADMQAQHPDHIAVTGDLVNLALKAEFPRARRWIEVVGKPNDVSLVPGNHDAYVHGAAEKFAETFGDYICSDEAAEPNFPYLRIREPVALIGVSSGVSTAPFMATGWLGDPQREALDRLLASLSDTHLFRVLLIHHPLRSEKWMKRLTDSDALQALLKRHGVELILHGHDHIHSTMWFEGPQRRIPAIGVPSASSLAHGHKPAAAYNLFAIARDGERWRCEQTVRGFGDSNVVHELKRTVLV
jgi:3',5'-cyclic AMP phosphodiesterase CpdA